MCATQDAGEDAAGGAASVVVPPAVHPSGMMVAGEGSEDDDSGDGDSGVFAASASASASADAVGGVDGEDGESSASSGQHGGESDVDDDDDDGEELDLEFLQFKADENNRGAQRMADGVMKAIKPALHHIALRLVALQEAQQVGVARARHAALV